VRNATPEKAGRSPARRIVVGQAGTDGCAEGFGGLIAADGDERPVIRQVRMRLTQEGQQGKTVVR